MRLVWRVCLLLCLVALGFAVGGGGGGGGSSGGGGSPPKKDYTLTYNFSCPGNVLQITAKEGSSGLAGATVNLHLEGFRVASDTTDANGQARFTITGSSPQYHIYVSKEGYKTKDAGVRIDLCTAADSEQPELLFCEEGTTRQERVRCRVELDPEYVRNVQYIPEECRARGEANPWARASVQEQCIRDYRFFQTCREGLESDEERTTCIKPKLNISGEVHTILEGCKAQLGSSRALCVQQTKEHVLQLVKFRMYNLEYKAEEFMKAGVPEQDVVDIVVKIQEAKIAFDQAPTFAEKKEVVRQLQQDWQAFVEKARLQLGAAA